MELLRARLIDEGADLVGFADLRGLPGAPLPYGVSVAVRLPVEIVRSIGEGPTRAYYDAYHTVNRRLDRIVAAGISWLAERGHRASGAAASVAVGDRDHVEALPHKTVATRAGLGWIGRCALLVTPEYGGAVRISSLYTDAALDCAQPVTRSRCGGCRACQQHCPAGAIRGASWEPATPLEELVDIPRCRRTARDLAEERIGIRGTFCGRCFVVCPHTRRYLDREEDGI